MKATFPGSAAPETPWKSLFWKTALLASGTGIATWLLFAWMVSPTLSGQLPPLPEKLPTDSPVLYSLLQSADSQARQTPIQAASAGRLGMIYHANQFYSQAEAIYRLSAQWAPTDYRWPYCLALLKEETGLEMEVPAWLEKSVQLNARYYPALQKLADIAYKQDRLEDAERYYRQSAEAGGKDSACQAIAGLSRVAARRKGWDKVVSYLAPISRENPQLRTFHQWLQEAYAQLGQKEKAEEESRILLEPTLIVIPLVKDPLSEELLGYSCSATRLLKEAGLKSRFRQPDEAIRVARQAVEVEPGDPDAHHFLARTLLEAHGSDPNAVEEALGHLREGLRRRPEALLPLWYFASFFFQQDKTTSAVEQLKSLLAAGTNRPESYYYLGLVADRLGDKEEAMTRYQDALHHDPENAEACHKLGLLLVTRGNLAEAIRYFQQAVRWKPMFTLARCNLGIALEQQGKTAQAITQFEEAIRSKPNDAISHQYLAIALLKSGKTDTATRHFREAVRFSPDDAEAHYGLGCALMMQKQLKEAEAEFRQVLRLQPDHPEAGKRLTELGP
jgi:tetratricopeptide (TPR) repeat protein